MLLTFNYFVLMLQNKTQNVDDTPRINFSHFAISVMHELMMKLITPVHETFEQPITFGSLKLAGTV